MWINSSLSRNVDLLLHLNHFKLLLKNSNEMVSSFIRQALQYSRKALKIHFQKWIKYIKTKYQKETNIYIALQNSSSNWNLSACSPLVTINHFIPICMPWNIGMVEDSFSKLNKIYNKQNIKRKKTWKKKTTTAKIIHIWEKN
jgi:hypothetical protein